MKINKKAIKVYCITFLTFLILYIVVFALGLENNRRGGTYISGAIHPKSLNEVWQNRNVILFITFGMTLLFGIPYNYLDRKK